MHHAAKFLAAKSLDMPTSRHPEAQQDAGAEPARRELDRAPRETSSRQPSGTGDPCCRSVLAWQPARRIRLYHGGRSSAMMEARDERRLSSSCAGWPPRNAHHRRVGLLCCCQRPSELSFELVSHSERGSTLITSNLPFDEWTETLERGLVGTRLGTA
ncbi:hypothetical protein [Aquamicrobium sp.]|uniref:hypothetical protein n=1 Tax=Aquamicrobium sp. TaxID=1872579 RepID=UPI00349EC803